MSAALVLGSTALDGHLKSVYLAETAIAQVLNEWIGATSHSASLDETVQAVDLWTYPAVRRYT
ncbi:hypothetical protein EV191_1235 [Tamaricihabitans halophyticus]|uniref:Uncharacterized protein n=1 Tax=Tamaricihabitans halophyticus TaxID=1262583 RepID=A0A4V2SRH9_9PSEU|nr:hypothetical protein [Tamaricihabitans halophyticus]TCP42606.1 hypothetical protein EV191_1235 [Tamaricihabitans halophyticus]